MQPEADDIEVVSLTVAIARDPDTVFDFFVDPRNLPRWARATAARPAGDGWWSLDTPGGTARVRFRPDRAQRIADHDYEGAGRVWHVPARVVAHGSGAALVLTISRPAGLEGREFTRQLESIRRELEALKQVLEA